MKKNIYVFILAFFAFGISTSAQKTHSCCAAPTIHGEVAMLSNDSGFVASHLSPSPLSFTAGSGENIRFATNGAEAGGYLVKSPEPSAKYVFVFHEWWGLNDYIRRESENLQKALGNVNVLAIDLYDGNVTASADSAARFMGSVQPERCREIIDGALQFAGKDAQVATLGWCFGGGWSLQAAMQLQKNAKACVIYYGMPEKDAARLKTLQCDVLGIFALKDKWISPEVVSGFETAMKEAGKKLSVKNYDADHAFANPSNPKYNENFGNDAMQHAIAFLKEKLRIGKK